MDLTQLLAEFPRDVVSWRAQSVSKFKDEALALAYIDARDVMRRLDAVCGPENWEDSYVETPKGRVICTIRILVGDAWVAKSDGAGDTDVEGDKGAISDSFKRAAVKWGIGRYLYDVESPWVPCEVNEVNGKRYWKKWTVDPWSCVKKAANKPATAFITDDQRDIIQGLAGASGTSLQTICEGYQIDSLKQLPASKYAKLVERLKGLVPTAEKVVA